VIIGDLVVAAVIGAALALMFFAMWFAWPTAAARRRHQ
jgi:hypothetical protein